MDRAFKCLALAGALALAVAGTPGCKGCKRSGADTPAPAPASSAQQKNAPKALFAYAAARRENAPLPARFSAALPASDADLERADAHPPFKQVKAAVCSGDERTLAKVLIALQQASKRQTLSEALSARYRELFEFCSDPGPSPWLAKTIVAEKDPAVQRALWAFAGECGASARELILRAESPGEVVVRWYFENGLAWGARHGDARAALTPRLAQAARGIATRQRGRDLRELAVVLGQIDDPQALPLVRELTKQLDPASGAWLAVGLGRQSSSAAEQLHRNACRHPDWLELREALRSFASVDELLTRLQALSGFDAKSARNHPELLPSAHPRTVLRAYDKIHSFDVETGSFPNDHDALLAELAALAGSALRSVVFEEIPPQVDWQPVPGVPGAKKAPDSPRAPYRLRAYRGGTRYEVDARDLGDWYDVEAVLGLLNTLLRDARSDLRYVALATGDQMADVTVGRMALLEEAASSGWLRAGAPDAAQAEGTAAEEQVFQALEAEGGAPQRDIVLPQH